jgi:hypothetical protein
VKSEPSPRDPAPGQEPAPQEANGMPVNAVQPRGGTEPLVWPELGARRAPCPVCGFLMSAIQGSRAAICDNCGFKDGCC